MKFITTLLLLLTGLTFAQQSVTLPFAATLNNQMLACGITFENAGMNNTSIEIQDMRFYVSDIRLINTQGEEVPLVLDQNPWQYQTVALLDFEDGSGHCAASGNEAMNHTVTGTIAEGTYTGVTFNMGVPFELNHADAATAPSPLNISSLFWSWQGGYKHARMDLLTHGKDPAELWAIHIGSTGCVADARVMAPQAPCANPNLVNVRLENIDLNSSVIVADIGALLTNVDVSQSLELAPPGCMSGADDPDCSSLFKNLGLTDDAGQVMFYAMPAAALTTE